MLFIRLRSNPCYFRGYENCTVTQTHFYEGINPCYFRGYTNQVKINFTVRNGINLRLQRIYKQRWIYRQEARQNKPRQFEEYVKIVFISLISLRRINPRQFGGYANYSRPTQRRRNGINPDNTRIRKHRTNHKALPHKNKPLLIRGLKHAFTVFVRINPCYLRGYASNIKSRYCNFSGINPS